MLKEFFKNRGWNDEKIKSRFLELGLSYKNIFDYWDGKIDKQEFIDLGIMEEVHFAKRQKTFIKKFFNNLPDNNKIKKEIKIIS